MRGLYEARARVEETMGLIDSAIEDHKRAVSITPWVAGIYEELAVLFNGKKDFESARVMVDLALIGLPGDAASLNRLLAKPH